MPPTAARSGQRTIGAPAGSGHAGPRGGSGPSKQARWVPGDGQAVALNAAAAAATERARQAAPDSRPVPRAHLIRRIIVEGLARPVDDVCDQGEVPAAHDSVPRDEKSVTWVPEPDTLDALTRQGRQAGGISRNETIRRHAAWWLARQEPNT